MKEKVERKKGKVKTMTAGLARSGQLIPQVGFVLLFSFISFLCCASLRADDGDTRDLQQEVMVRKALADDARLKPLNLIVRVQGRVATLSGPVPSRELARRALDAARKLPELRDVNDKMMVQFEDAGLLLALQPRNPIPEQRTPNWRPINPETNSRLAADAGLLPWNTPAPGLTEAVSRPRETPAVNLKAVVDVGTAVQNLIQAEERYRRMHFEVKQGKVYLSGVVSRWADLEDLAKAVTRLPGVEGVVLSEVKTAPPRW